ncbi:MAG: nuclear transport factor 2 family protein [Thermoplasmata archaeon]|nr:nuclear transport factor 2 family protein [Thermoplasmata archaeon]
MEEEILALEERLRLGDASSEPDTSAIFDELLADEVLFVQENGNSVGKAGVLRGHRPPRKRSFTKVVNSEVAVRDLGSVVAVSCRTDYSLEDRTFAFRALRLWAKVGAEWRVAVVALITIPKSGG